MPNQPAGAQASPFVWVGHRRYCIWGWTRVRLSIHGQFHVISSAIPSPVPRLQP